MKEQSTNLQNLTQELLASDLRMSKDTPQSVCDAAGWKYTGAALLVAGVWLKAKSGDVNAAKLIREMNGETTDMDGAGDLSALSDAALWAIARSAVNGAAGIPAAAVPVPPEDSGEPDEVENMIWI